MRKRSIQFRAISKTTRNSHPIVRITDSLHVHQRSNAALAVALCRQLAAAEASASGSASPPAVERAEADMRLLAEGRLPPAWRAGLEAAEWPGRAQVVQDSG